MRLEIEKKQFLFGVQFLKIVTTNFKHFPKVGPTSGVVLQLFGLSNPQILSLDSCGN
jgi:hypothetical protein